MGFPYRQVVNTTFWILRPCWLVPHNQHNQSECSTQLVRRHALIQSSASQDNVIVVSVQLIAGESHLQNVLYNYRRLNTWHVTSTWQAPIAAWTRGMWRAPVRHLSPPEHVGMWRAPVRHLSPPEHVGMWRAPARHLSPPEHVGMWRAPDRHLSPPEHVGMWRAPDRHLSPPELKRHSLKICESGLDSSIRVTGCVQQQ